MEEHIADTIERIHERNERVEADKAWETSLSRTMLIALITYASASLFLYMIGVEDWMLSALVPVGGFILSTLSLTPLKKWWIQRYLRSKE